MNTTEDKMKKPPTPSGRGAARIAALERECAGWMDASTRFQRQRNASDAVLAEIEAALPPAYPNEFGLAQRVRGLVARSAPRTEPGLSPRTNPFRQTMGLVGKHAAGRLLDGREWNEVPNAKR